MLLQMIDVLGPIIIITAIGYLMGRTKMGTELRALGPVIILVATPALVFHTLTSIDVAPGTIQVMSGAAVFCLVIAGSMGALILFTFGSPVRSFLPSLMLPNSGNLGLPLVLLAFGPEGFQLAVAYFFVVALAQHSLGLSIYAGGLKLSILLKQPLMYAVAAVVIVAWTGITVPAIVMTTTEMLGGMMIPAMLMLLGASLATLEIADLRPALFIAFARLGIGVISAIVVIWVLDFEGIMAGTVFLLASMPTAIVNYVYAERFQRNARQVAGSVVVSTILTFLCLPVLVWTALAIAQTP